VVPSEEATTSVDEVSTKPGGAIFGRQPGSLGETPGRD
jgi:hypothetical protein